MLYCSSLVHTQNFGFREFSLKKGLPQSQVKAISQDADGFLWVGTLGGLARFDGKKFEVFTMEQGLLNNRITFIYFLGEKLIVGHESGLSIRIAPNLFKAFSAKNFPESSRFSHALEFRNRLLVSTNGSGLYELKNDELVPIQVKIKDESNRSEFQRIRKMTVLGDRLFFGTRGGLFFTKDLKEIDLIEETLDWSISDVKSIENNLLLATYNEGAYQLSWDRTKKISIHQIFQDPCAEIDFYHVDATDSYDVWILTEENSILRNQWYAKSLMRRTGNSDLLLTSESGLPKEAITTIFTDSQGVLWLGTEGKGLFQFQGEAFSKHAVAAPVLTVLQDKNQALWFGTLGKGLFSDLNQVSKSTVPDELQKTTVWCSLKDRQGNLWFGTSSGLFIFNGKNWMLWQAENQDYLPDNKIAALHEDKQGEIWIGTRRGIAKSKDLVLDSTNTSIFLELQVIRDICTYQNQLIVATKNHLYRLDKKTSKTFAFDIKNLNPTFSCLFVDKKNTLWIGTEEGLFILSENELKSVNYGESSAEKFINFIISINESVIIGTNNGLFEFSAYSEDLSEFKLRHFDESYGLTGTETNIKSAFKQPGGFQKLWFGTSDGLFRFDPNKLNTALDSYRPKLFLDDFQVNFISTSDIQWDQEVRLKYNQNRLRFIFQILDLYHFDKVSLEYRLTDQEAWLPAGSDSEIVFNQLASGPYSLQVRARGGNGNYSDVLIFNFLILNPFYASWWFIFIVVLSLGLITLVVVNYRIQQIRTQETQERLELNNRLNALEQQSLNASMNRHFIFNALNSIQYFINTQDKLSANKYLSKFAQLIRKNLDSSASGENKVTLDEEIQRLKLYLSLESMRFSGRFDYVFEIDEDIASEEICIPPMLFQPFIENAIIHGILPNEQLEGKIVFSAVQDGNRIIFTITDNGVGYSKSLTGKKEKGDHFSHGTNITKSRIEVIRKISGDVIDMRGPEDILDVHGNIAGTKVVISILV